MTPRTHLATARLYAAEKAPYFRAALMNLVPYEMPGLGTVGVTKTAVMMFDPLTIMEWSIEEMAGALIHEISHLLRDHFGRAASMGIIDENGRGLSNEEDPTLWNIAGDCEINDDIEVGGWELPTMTNPETKEKQGPQRAAMYGLKDGKTAEEYYYDIKKQQKDGDGKGKGKGKKGGKGKGKGDGTGKAPGHGWCGSAGGKALPNEPDQKEVPGRSETDLNRIAKQCAEEIRREAEKGRGTIPAGWERWAGEVLRPAKIPWQQRLQRAARRALADILGTVDYRYKRPSRRQGAIGYGIGKPVLPIMRAPKPEVVIAIDTSGSMGQQELDDAITESRGVLQATGAEVTFMSCDAVVHMVKRARTWKDIANNLKGGGGTDFRPVFDKMKTERIRPDIVIFITDGMGPAPERKPNGMHVIWLLVGPCKQKPCTWGEHIEYERDDAETNEAA